MTPLLYLKEEYENVSTTLKETLRHDYGSSDAEAYYVECTQRLDGIKRLIDQLDDADPRISSQLAALAGIANRVALIERSHLGEFSWPFAETVRTIADRILAERGFRRGERLTPIIHIIAEGTGYNVRNEKSPEHNVRKRIAIVAFPRQLKHHVLMHAILGHELGHAAFHTTLAGAICEKLVIPELRRTGPLNGPSSLEDWLRSPAAPTAVREQLKAVPNLRVQAGQVEQWSLELMCDLFGLLLFGPAFAAAHRTLLEPASRSPHEVEFKNSTHPPLAVRRRTLISAMRMLGWDRCATGPEDGLIHEAEKAMLGYVMDDDDDAWTSVFADDQLETAIGHLKTVFADAPELLAGPPSRHVVRELVDRLARRLPPILEEIDDEGVASQLPMSAGDCLYAGWTYWFGRDLLSGDAAPLTFLQTNRLCDHALLQQRAIDLVRDHVE